MGVTDAPTSDAPHRTWKVTCGLRVSGYATCDMCALVLCRLASMLRVSRSRVWLVRSYTRRCTYGEVNQCNSPVCPQKVKNWPVHHRMQKNCCRHAKQERMTCCEHAKRNQRRCYARLGAEACRRCVIYEDQRAGGERDRAAEQAQPLHGTHVAYISIQDRCLPA